MPPIAIAFGSLVTNTLHAADATLELTNVSEEKDLLSKAQASKVDDLNAMKRYEDGLIDAKFGDTSNDYNAMIQESRERNALNNKYDAKQQKLSAETTAKEQILEKRQQMAEQKRQVANANVSETDKLTKDSAGKAGIKWN